MNRRELSSLLELLHEPTAPFREAHVVRFATAMLERARVPYFPDASGNILIGADSERAYKQLLTTRAHEPLRMFVAHMDHPGFHGTRWLTSTRLHVRWHGGAPVRGLNGAKIWLADNGGYVGLGQMRRPKLDASGRRLLEAEVTIERSARLVRPPAGELFGGFRDRAPAWRAGKLLYTKAADDLVGVFAILRTAVNALARGRRAPFVGLLTRAEEVGFIGMIAHLEHYDLARAKRELVCISLETSRTLPGADIGKGPVVRLGDRRGVFDPSYLRVLTETAERTLPGKHQKRIMDGGSCEATAALAHGVRAIGISVPLGNYHNESFDPRTRGKPAPEYVHLDDVAGLLKLCAALAKPGLSWDKPWKKTREGLGKNFKSYKRLLGKS